MEDSEDARRLEDILQEVISKTKDTVTGKRQRTDMSES